MLKPFIAKTINLTDLTDKEAEEAMTIIMTIKPTDATTPISKERQREG